MRLFLWAQDGPHGATDAPQRRGTVQVSAPASGKAGSDLSRNGRIRVLTEAEDEHSRNFELAVEAGCVGVTLQSPTRVVFIENKNASEALQDGQILRYTNRKPPGLGTSERQPS